MSPTPVSSDPSSHHTRASALYAMAVLFAINALNFFDRVIAGALAEPIRQEWDLSDSAVGWLGTAFILIYAAVGLPCGRLADRTRRQRVLAAGVFLWTIATAASGLATNYLQLFLTRLGVGVGEATCAPAATSLIGDLYPAGKRARALSVFMLGLPVGIALSYAVSSSIAYAYGWREAFFVAGVPGVLCALAVLWLREPKRGAAEEHAVGARLRHGSPYLLVLSIPTMWWLIVSGALHNFNMYALGTFLSPYLMRFHGTNVLDAGLILTLVYGLCGVPGLILGGLAGDAVIRRRANGRLLLSGAVMLVSAPLLLFALRAQAGRLLDFSVLMGAGCALAYVYYATVYATIHDVTEPSLRGTAMALYFLAMYAIGAALGPVLIGAASDHFTQNAALRSGVTDLTPQGLEPFRAAGLRSALYLVPLLAAFLALVLFAAARTVGRDRQKLEAWMRCAASD